MLRITKETDYGLMLLARMAGLPPGQVLSAPEAAEWSGLPLPMVSKILKRLARSEIVTSSRGVAGGYRLTGPAQETSIADVIRALEGPIGFVECTTHPGVCEHEPRCPMRPNWSRINRELERTLERIPITAMIDSCTAGLVPLGCGQGESEPELEKR
jgi:FeS assembly SUF system regulator